MGKKTDWKELAEITSCILVYGGLFIWLVYSTFTQGFTELILFIWFGIGLLVSWIFLFTRTSMDMGAAIGFAFISCVMWAVFFGIVLFRLFQWFLE